MAKLRRAALASSLVAVLSLIQACTWLGYGPTGETAWYELMKKMERVTTPRWTPDGSRIVFSVGHGAIYSVKADGSDLARVSPDAKGWGHILVNYSPDISPDGSRLAYATRRHKLPREYSEQYVFQIETARLDGTDRRRLTYDEHENVSPAWSPSGERIAFARVVSRRDHLGGIYTMASDGSDLLWLTGFRREDWKGTEAGIKASYGQLLSGPLWSPDGQRLAYVTWGYSNSETTNARQEIVLYLVNADGTGLKRRVAIDSNYGTGRILSPPAWSPDGQTLAFVMAKSAEDGSSKYSVGIGLYTIKADGKESPEFLTSTRYALFRSLEWSPDGSKLLLATSQTARQAQQGGPRQATYVVNADGSDLQLIGNGIAATWSPDGSLVALANQHLPSRAIDQYRPPFLLAVVVPGEPVQRVLVEEIP